MVFTNMSLSLSKSSWRNRFRKSLKPWNECQVIKQGNGKTTSWVLVLLKIHFERSSIMTTDITAPYKLSLWPVGYELPSTWLFRCVFCPHNTPWPGNLRSEEASSSSESSSAHRSSASQCHMEQKGELEKQDWISILINPITIYTPLKWSSLSHCHHQFEWSKV